MDATTDEAAATDEPGDAERREAQRALAGQIRALSAAALLTTEDVAVLSHALDLVREATGILERPRRSSRYDGNSGLSAGILAENDAVWETHGAFGQSNPMAPPVTVTERPGRVEGTLTFGAQHEGGPGTVYGGFIAAAFDGVLGRAVISSGRLGVTRSLTVRYLAPTPLFTPLRIEAAVQHDDDRAVEISGRLWAGEHVTCEAEATFRSVDATRYRAAKPDDRPSTDRPT